MPLGKVFIDIQSQSKKKNSYFFCFPIFFSTDRPFKFWKKSVLPEIKLVKPYFRKKLLKHTFGVSSDRFKKGMVHAERIQNVLECTIEKGLCGLAVTKPGLDYIYGLYIWYLYLQPWSPAIQHFCISVRNFSLVLVTISRLFIFFIICIFTIVS